jgi:hypothetical protein
VHGLHVFGLCSRFTSNSFTDENFPELLEEHQLCLLAGVNFLFEEM